MAKVVDIQKASKVVPFTITPIGDKQALAYWKLERAKIEREWQAAQEPKRQERRAIAVKQIEEQLGRKFKEDEKEELTVLNGAQPAKRRRFKVKKQERLEQKWLEAQKPLDPERAKTIDEEFKKFMEEHYKEKSLSTKIKESLIKFWNSAFPK